MVSTRPIVVAGAGSVGCFVGGLLAAGGRSVSLLARPRVLAEIEQNGLRLTGFNGFERRVPAARLRLSDHPSILRDAAMVLVTVKNMDTAAMADEIATHAPSDAIVVSLQNGIANRDVLRSRCAGRVLAGMVPFNIMALGEGHYHQATSGDIALEQDEAGTAAQLAVEGLAVRAVPDILAVLWGKLLLNLNNALNALSGLPLRDQLAQRPWRLLLAEQMTEALQVLKAEGIVPAAASGVAPRFIPHVLRLPDALFRVVSGGAMRIDASARSSMWEDLQRRRPTEIDFLQGAVVALAERHGVDVPLTRRVMALVAAAEREDTGSPGLRPDQVRG